MFELLGGYADTWDAASVKAVAVDKAKKSKATMGGCNILAG